MAQAKAAGEEDAAEPQSLPDVLFDGEIDRPQALREKLDAACRRLEAETATKAADAQERL